jgi:hypothetical protein
LQDETAAPHVPLEVVLQNEAALGVFGLEPRRISDDFLLWGTPGEHEPLVPSLPACGHTRARPRYF